MLLFLITHVVIVIVEKLENSDNHKEENKIFTYIPTTHRFIEYTNNTWIHFLPNFIKLNRHIYVSFHVK